MAVLASNRKRRKSVLVYYELSECYTYFNPDTLINGLCCWMALQMQIEDVKDTGIPI